MSLIEQVMVLTIVAVLMGAAVPPMRHLISRNELRVAQTDFIGALRQTRQTAVLSGRRTILCPSWHNTGCSTETNWDNGWLLAHDRNRDDQPDDGPLRVGHDYQGKVFIRSSNGRHIVRFHPDGSASGSNMTLLFCQPSHPSDALVVVVSNAGRVRGAHASDAQIATCSTLH